MKMMRIVRDGCVALPVLFPSLVVGQSLPSVPVYSYSVPAPTATTGYATNGNLLSYTDSVNGSWSMQYDSLNRLSNASGTAGAYNTLVLGWQYDAFGNRQNQTVAGNPPTAGVQGRWATYNGNNQVISNNLAPAPNAVTYDAAGDNRYDGNNLYLYDAEGRVCAAWNGITGSVTQYFYDAEGQRVAKADVGRLACALGGSASTTASATYVLGPSGEQMTEFGIMGTWKHTNIFANGQLLATYDTIGLHFPLSDPLGTVRVQASGQGVPEETFSSLPYGDGMMTNTLTDSQDATEHHFTGKERDAESGNDYFGARYYASTMGRFLSPDWSVQEEPVPYARLDNPQTLNLYAYVGNNPLARIDVDGHAVGDAERALCAIQHDCDDKRTVAAQQQIGKDPTLPTEVDSVTVTAKPSVWKRIGSWFGGAAHGISYAATVFVITHSKLAMEGNKSSFEYWSKQSDEAIIKSLNPGGKEPMQIRMDGDEARIINGNMRYSILQSRGADLSGLKPEVLPPVMLEPMVEPMIEPEIIP